MSVYSLANASDASIQAAIVEFVGNMAGQDGAEAIAGAPRRQGAAKRADIEQALGLFDDRVSRNLAALVDDATLTVDMTHPDPSRWAYAVA